MSITICNGQHVEGYDYNGSNTPEATEHHRAQCHEVTFAGAVLKEREYNGPNDSDFYALVWDEEAQETREVWTGTTASWTYHNGSRIDATREVLEKAVAYMTGVRFAEWVESHESTVRMGYTARAVEDGVPVEGVIAWEGYEKPRGQWAARYGTRTKRYGIRVEGRRGYVFRNADAEDFSFDVLEVSAEDMIAWRARCEENVRVELRQAFALADEREPVVGPYVPGTVVDAVEADEDGMRLYAVGEWEAEEEWARGVADAVVDAGAEYAVTGTRADGSAMPGREVTAFRVSATVVRWAQGEGTRILHDGRGAVRMVREDGAVMVLRPVGGAVEGVSASVEAVEGGGGSEERRVAVEAVERLVRDSMDGGAGHYRRVVLTEGGGRGASGVMTRGEARAYLVAEVVDGGMVEREGLSQRVVLTRANGARLVLEPVRGVVPLAG